METTLLSDIKFRAVKEGIYIYKQGCPNGSAVQSDARCDSELIRSTTMGILMACPHENLAPLMAWIEERRREKARRQRSQHRVRL